MQKQWVVPLVAFASLACTAEAPPEPSAPPAAATSPYAAYVLLVESPSGEAVPFARVVVDDGDPCPRLSGGDVPIATARRLDPHGFAVDVCEAVVPWGRALGVDGSGLVLPAAHRRVTSVAVFGDTGCKPDDQQGCGLDDPEWPFARLAAAAAAESPDLVLHVGDYNYRGTPSHFDREENGEQVKVWYYDGGDGTEPSEMCGVPGPYYSQNSTGNPDADTWQAWWLDFFQPAAPLLAAAPWVAARGNHELCSHAGPGWLFFLGPGSQLVEGGGAQAACPSQDGEGPAPPHLVFVPPQVIALDGLTIALVDNANACDELPNFSDRYAAQLGEVDARLTAAGVGADDQVWFAGHRPVWGVDGTSAGPPYGCDGKPTSGPAQPYDVLNVTLQCAFASPSGAALLPKLDLSIAGHMHRFEQLSWSAGAQRPPQLVAGNGGVAEETDPPVGRFAQTVDGEAASGYTVDEFGFVLMRRGDDGAWSGAVVTPDPAAWDGLLPACGTEGEGGGVLCVEGSG